MHVSMFVPFTFYIRILRYTRELLRKHISGIPVYWDTFPVIVFTTISTGHKKEQHAEQHKPIYF